jgi:hypothetical protein
MPILRILAALVLTVGVATAAEPQLLRLLPSDEPIKGELVSIDGKTLIFKTEEKTVSKPLVEVLKVDLQPAPANASVTYHQVELTDGSQLSCKPDGIVFKGKKVELTLVSDVKLEVPLTALSYILKDANDPKVRDNADWKTILKGRRNQDMVVRWYQGRLNGIAGAITDGKDHTVNFILEGSDTVRPIDLRAQNTQGCVFVNKPDPGAPAPICRLLDVNHNLLMVSKLELPEGGNFVFTTVSGTKMDYRRDLVVRLDYSWGKRTFLSDMDKDVTIVAEPGEDFAFPNRFLRDKNGDGNPLQLGGQRFPKGLFVPARTKLAFKVGGEFNEFSAQVGVDEAVRGKSHVRLIIEGDGKELFNAEFKNGEPRREVRIIIKNVQELRIAVEPVNIASVDGNHLDLADAKISK